VHRLEGERQTAAAALAALKGRPNTAPAELQAAKDKLQAIDERLTTAGILTPKARGAEYEGEFEKYGWRADSPLPKPPMGETPEQRLVRNFREAEFEANKEKYRESKLKLTKEFTAEERERAELNVKPDGTVEGAQDPSPDGTVAGEHVGPMNGHVEYVMDPSGKMHQFTQKQGGVIAGQVKHPVTNIDVDQTVVTHHSSVLAGEAVAGAGEVDFAAGKITKISNKSGHYKPSIANLLQTVEVLARQGALLDKDLWMLDPATGKGKPLDGEALDAHKRVQTLEAQLAPQMRRVQQLRAIIEGKGGRPDDTVAEFDELEVLDTAMLPSLTALKQAQTVEKDLFREWGVGPRNKFRKVTVEAIDGKDSDKGNEFIHGAKVQATAEQFLASGGGSANAKAAKEHFHQLLTRGGKAEARQAEFRQTILKLTTALGQHQAAQASLNAEIARLRAATSGPKGNLADVAQLNAAKALLSKLVVWIGQAKPIVHAEPSTDPREQAMARRLEAEGQDLQTELAKLALGDAPAPSAAAPPASPPPSGGSSPAAARPKASEKPGLSPEEVAKITALDSAIQTLNRDGLTPALTGFGIDAATSKTITDAWAVIEDPGQPQPKRVEQMGKLVKAINAVKNKQVNHSLLKLQRALVQRYL
jgi:hypothetical protein